ncbi:MAG: hypothetical protein WB586_08965 [Chthoniobacterales bacterium]
MAHLLVHYVVKAQSFDKRLVYIGAAAYPAEIHVASVTLTPSDVTTGVSGSALPAGKSPSERDVVRAWAEVQFWSA